MKVAMISLALMQDNNRELNNKNLDYALENYQVDVIAILDQEFKPEDYREHDSIKYVGHVKKRGGFIHAENKLLKWFYDSDYDWAVFVDSNVKIGKSSLNDFNSIIAAIKRGDLEDIDIVESTAGQHPNMLRSEAKKLSTHNEIVRLTTIPEKYTESAWLDGMFIKNFKKYYDKEIFIDERSKPELGLSPDLYLTKVFRKVFEYRLCPTIMINVPPAHTSTWRTADTGFKYPKIDWHTLEKLVKEADIEPVARKGARNNFELPRVDFRRETITKFVSREERRMKGKGKLL